MKDINKNSQKDFIYKVIKYSDNEVIKKVNNFEKLTKKTISNNNRKVAYMNFFI